MKGDLFQISRLFYIQLFIILRYGCVNYMYIEIQIE